MDKRQLMTIKNVSPAPGMSTLEIDVSNEGAAYTFYNPYPADGGEYKARLGIGAGFAARVAFVRNTVEGLGFSLYNPENVDIYSHRLSDEQNKSPIQFEMKGRGFGFVATVRINEKIG